MSSSFDAISAMGDVFRSWIDQHTDAREAAVGELLINEGSNETRLWLLVSGNAHVRTAGRGGQPTELAVLGAGALVGEMSVLEGRPAVASVMAGEGCRVIQIDPQALAEAMDGSATLACDVNSLFARKLAQQLAAQNYFIHRWQQAKVEPLRKALVVFAHLTDVDVEWLAEKGGRRRFPDKSVLLHQGEAVPDLLLLLLGIASVSLATSDGLRKVGTSRTGELLGEMSLVGGDDLATATVRALGPVEVLAIPKAKLRERLANDPAFGSRFYRAMALLLSQRSRDQLQSHGLAANALQVEIDRRVDLSLSKRGGAAGDLELDEGLDLEQMGAISRAGLRFDWLCRHLGVMAAP